MMHNNFSDKVMPQESSALDSSSGVSQVVHDMIDERRSASAKMMPRKPDIVDDNGQLSFTNIFNAFDRNKDGNINQAEFAAFFGLDKPPVHDRPVAPPPGKHPGGPPDVVIDPIERPPVGRDPGCDLPPLPRPSHPPDVVLDPIERPPFGKEPGDIIPPGSLDGIERPPIGKWPGRPPVSIDPIERPNSYTFRRNAL